MLASPGVIEGIFTSNHVFQFMDFSCVFLHLDPVIHYLQEIVIDIFRHACEDNNQLYVL